MNTVTRLLTLLAVAALFAPTVLAQTQVTLREVNAVPQENLQTLQDLGIDATGEDIDANIVFPLLGQEVQFTAVVLGDPYNSGLRTFTGATTPIHLFVRDTTANSLGYEGMNVQLVDGSGSISAMQPGFVYDIIGEVGEFNNVVQVSPTSFQSAGPYSALGLPDAIVEPIVATTGDLNRVVGQDGDGNDLYQVNWLNFNDYNNQYVRFESAVIQASVADDTGRPNWQFSSTGSDAVVNADDISLRFRNNRSGADDDYPNPPWNTRPADDPFVPPAAGAVVEVQGFAALRAFDFDNDIAESAMSVAPWEDEDLQSLESPPVFGDVQGPTDVPGNGPVTISVEVTQGSLPVQSVVLSYEATSGEDADVTLTNDGSGTYSGQIPVVADGAFVTYTIEASDTEGSTSEIGSFSYRVLYDGIDSIEDVQLTAGGGPGSSPFAGITTTNIDISAVVMSDLETSGLLTIQDDPSLEAWTGIFVEVTEETAGLQPGDRVSITGATITENFGVTQLSDATVSVTSGGEPYAYKVVPTGVLAQDDATAEAHEGMALRFENVEITDVNADGDDTVEGFGEWQFSSDGSEANEVRADDASDAISQDFSLMNFTVGQEIGAIQGLWWFSFGNYKLVPESPADIFFTVDAEDGSQAGRFLLDRAYPNPFSGTTTIAFELGEAGPVSLTVYDVLGREVATLVDGELAATRHEATLDARGLAAGVYVYRLTAGDDVRTGRVTLVK